MSSKPKSQNYEPSKTDKINAAVGQAEYNYFKQNYEPLLKKMRDESQTEDATQTLRARANADTMQSLTSGLDLAGTQRLDAGSDMAQAYQGQLGLATSAGKNIQNQAGANVLQTARKQGSVAQTGLSKAARMGTSEALGRAKAKQTVASARGNMLGQIAGGAAAGGMNNKATGGTFLNPRGSDGNLDSTPFTKFTGFGAG